MAATGLGFGVMAAFLNEGFGDLGIVFQHYFICSIKQRGWEVKVNFPESLTLKPGSGTAPPHGAVNLRLMKTL